MRMLVILGIFTQGYAQDTKNKTYVLKDQPYKLVLTKDNKYHFIFNDGDVRIQKDTLYLNNPEWNVRNKFLVFNNTKAGNASDSLTLVFIGTPNLNSTSGYIDSYGVAFTVGNNAKPSKLLSVLESFVPASSYTKDTVRVKVLKENYLFLSQKDYLEKNVEEQINDVYSYAIPKNVSELIIQQNLVYNTDTKAVVNADKTLSVFFDQSVQPVIFEDIDHRITEPLRDKIAITGTSKETVLWNYYASISEQGFSDINQTVTEKKELKNKKSLKSLKEALENSGDKSIDLLWLVHEEDNELAEKLSNINDQSTYTYYTPDSTKRTLFYQIKKEDKKWFAKKGVPANAKHIIVNKDQNVLYYDTNSLIEHANAGTYSFGNQMEKHLQKLRQFSSFAEIIDGLKDKKTSVSQLKTLFYKAGVVLDYNTLYPYDLNAEKGNWPPTTAVPHKAVEETTTNTNDTTETVDAEAYKSSETDEFKFEGVLYKSTLTENEMTAAWAKVLEAYKNTYDKELYHTIYLELQDIGLSQKLLAKSCTLPDNNSINALSYYLKFISVAREESINYDYSQTTFPSSYEIEGAINGISKRQLGLAFNCQTKPSKEHQLKTIALYKNYVTKYIADVLLVSNLLELYKDTDNFDQAIIFYEEYLSNFKEDQLIVSLNNAYEKLGIESWSWSNYKNNFADMANTMAWEVVLKRPQYNATLKKALKWSQLSIQLSPNNSYYLNTLAQLHYLNGDKQKATEVQQKAIDIYKECNECIQEAEYNEMQLVLKKMKEATFE